MKTYNGVPLDGRPMSILIATSEVAQAAQRMSAPARKFGNTRGSPRKGGAGGKLKFIN